MAEACVGPECPNGREVGDVCRSHYQQRRRNPRAPLSPLRGDARPRIPNVRVDPATMKLLERGAKRLGMPLASFVSGVLDAWAERDAIARSKGMP